MWRGRVTRPTLRSVLARQRNKNFDGGWRDDTFVRATMIRTLANNNIFHLYFTNNDELCRKFQDQVDCKMYAQKLKSYIKLAKLHCLSHFF